jgi:hypothetical protein
MYKYKSTLEKIREVLIQYDSLETMCDIATCMLIELVPNIEMIAGEVKTDKKRNHVFAYDTKEKYYIDITSEQFGFPPCFCSQDSAEFEKLGYIIPPTFHAWNGAFQMFEKLKQRPVLIHEGKEITMAQLLSEIQKKKKTPKRWNLFGTRRKR